MITFIRTDTDATTNFRIYSMDKKTWIIEEVNKEWIHQKGAPHVNQYHPTSVKVKTTERANCITFSGKYTIYNPEDKG